jgi:hypothetical protein
MALKAMGKREVSLLQQVLNNEMWFYERSPSRPTGRF